jgi:integrase
LDWFERSGIKHLDQLTVGDDLLPYVSLHRFRKSYADTLADEGLPVPTIMKRLGHCSLDVTLAYLRGREAEGEQEQNFANQSALAVYA